MSQDVRLDEEQATQRRARVLGFDYYNTYSSNPKNLYHDILTVNELYQMRMIPILADKSNILFGITTTTSQQSMKRIQERFLDQRITFAIISDNGYRDYMKLYDPPKEIIYHDINIQSAETVDQLKEISSILDQVKAEDMLAYIVQQAHRLNSSDIHLETAEDKVRIRLRIDGILHPVAYLDFEKYRVLVSAIASAGNISTASEEAQQGHIAQKVIMADSQVVDVNVRLETVQTIHGMDIVMRIFNMDQSRYNLDKLNLSANERRVVDDIIAKPTGLVMIVGPTGSGKTTTLYSMLNSLNNEERKIITIEDPVEYQFSGITQISVKNNDDDNVSKFADSLRAVLRLDPDIVMVGEIRDNDTAKTSLQAALTGHLVLSTFHASSAAAALTRLADIIGQNPLFISAVRLIMAQRLIRRLDDNSKIAYQPLEREMLFIKNIISTLPPTIDKPDLDNITIYKAGVSETNSYGYRGQMAIREQLMLTDNIRQILERPNSSGLYSTQELEEEAVKSGMTTMLQDGILQVLKGQTSLEEIFRVIG